MGFFDKIRDADDTGGGVWIVPGQHRLRVKEVKNFESKNDGTDVVVVEYVVLESAADEGAFAEQRRQKEAGNGPYMAGKSYTPHAEGSTVSDVNKLGAGTAGKMAAGNVKAWFNTLTGGHAEDLDNDDYGRFFGPEQLARGAIFDCQAFDIETKAKDKMITRKNWTLVEPSQAMTDAANG